MKNQNQNSESKRGRKPRDMDFDFGNRPFTVQDVYNRYANSDAPISSVAINVKLAKLVALGKARIVGSKMNGKRGRPWTVYALTQKNGADAPARRRISLVSVRWQDLRQLIPSDFQGFITVGKKWLNQFSEPETRLVMIPRKEAAMAGVGG